MAHHEIFSKRQKRLRGEVPDVFSYEQIPGQLRVQVIHIWGDTIGHEHSDHIMHQRRSIPTFTITSVGNTGGSTYATTLTQAPKINSESSS
jgi:hypothetical protein